MLWVTCLDTGERFGYTSCTPYEALSGLLYTLNLENMDRDAVINKTDSGLHLYFDHSGRTYSIAA